jgi:3-deoxy-D-arabino-heptulosonate 7-phosphate (DAHP) synthase
MGTCNTFILLIATYTPTIKRDVLLCLHGNSGYKNGPQYNVLLKLCVDKCYSRQYIATAKLSFNVTHEHGSFSALHPLLNPVTAVVLRSGNKDTAYPRA